MTPDLRRVSACALTLLVLAACSGDDEPSAEPTINEATTTVASTVAPTTTSPVTTTTAPIVPSTTMAAASFDEWCVLSREAEELTEEAAQLFQSGPEGVREYIERIDELIEQATTVVPDELDADWAVSVQVSEMARDAIIAADYDILTADLSAIEDVAAESDMANDAIDAFNAEFCGIDPGSVTIDDDDVDFDPSLGSLKEQFIDVLMAGGFTLDEAECVFDAYDFTATDTIGEREAIVAALDACDIPPERAADIVDGGVG